MPNAYRVVALGVLSAVGAGAAGHFVRALPSRAAEPPPPTLLPVAYAAPAELAFRDTLQRGETLSQLLARTRLAQAEAQLLLDELQKHQDPRHLRAGAVVSYRTSTTSGAVRGLEFRLDADRTLRVQRAGEGWAAQVEEVEVRTDTAVLAGVVETSLYQGLLDGQGEGVADEERRAVADVLADRIFAWQVDFSRDLRPGDHFRVVYERQVRPDGSARSGQVLGVQFSVGGRLREAFLYRSADGHEDYYDAEGGSLKRAFLRAPLEFRRISSVFSTGRFHPILKKVRAHNGIDYAAASGTPVRAVGDGVVTKASYSGGYGNLVEIRHSRGYSSRYGHLRGFARGVRAGTRVTQGQTIGYVGSTGLSTGPHLHYEFHERGRPINPSSIKYLTGEPLSRGPRLRYLDQVRAQLALLERQAPASRLAARDDTTRRAAE